MPLLALIVVPAIWGITFVQVKDVVELYPLFAFPAVRFAIATVTLAAPRPRDAAATPSPATGSVRSGSAGCAAIMAGIILAEPSAAAALREALGRTRRQVR